MVRLKAPRRTLWQPCSRYVFDPTLTTYNNHAHCLQGGLIDYDCIPLSLVNPIERVEMWSVAPPVLQKAFAGARYACLLNVKSPQDIAGAALASALRDMLLASKVAHGRSFCPKVVGLSHVIEGNDHYMYLLFNKRASRAYERAVREGKVARALAGVHIHTIPSTRARAFARNV